MAKHSNSTEGLPIMDPRDRYKSTLLKSVKGPNERGGRRRSSSESDVIDPNNIPIYNIAPGGINIPTNAALTKTKGGSYPNLSGSNLGFTSTPSGPCISTRLRSRGQTIQPDPSSTVHQQVLAEYVNIKEQVVAWQNIINRPTVTNKDEIERIFCTFTAKIDDLANRCILERIDFKVHTDIVQLVPIVKRARRAHLSKLGIQEDETRRNNQDEDEDNAFLEDNLFADNLETGHLSDSIENGNLGEKQKNRPDSFDNTDCEIRQTQHQIINTIKALNTKQNQLPIGPMATPLPSQDEDGGEFHGFNSVIDEIEAIKDLIDRTKKMSESKAWKMEKKVSSISINLKKVENAIECLSINVTDIHCAVEANSARLASIEDKSYNLGVSVRALEVRIAKRFHNIEERLGIRANNYSEPQGANMQQGAEFEKVRSDIILLQQSASGERDEISKIKASINQLNNKLDNTVEDILNATTNVEDNYPRASQIATLKSMEIVKLGIERYVLQIQQLINLEVSAENPDLKLIEKCNNVDVPKISKAISSCGSALEKYIKIPGMDENYIDQVSTTLVDASEWCLRIEALYAKMEIHSINNSKGDTSNVGIFADNVGKSVYEFLEDMEMAFLCWGNNKQKGAKLFRNHLSESIKAKVMHLGDDYISIKAWLIKHYGDASRIVNDTVASLAKKKKPTSGNRKDRYTFYSEIVVALLRLERLTNDNLVDRTLLNDCLYSRSTLHILISLLPQSDYTDLKREFTRRDIDFNNPVGILTFTCFKDFCTIERNAMEASIGDEPESASLKPKLVKATHGAQFSWESGSENDDENCTQESNSTHAAGVSTSNNTSQQKQWYIPGLQFPCPLDNHKHEVTACTQFFALCPKERWKKIRKRRICWTCLKPKDVCKNIKCSFVKKVPEELICSGCIDYAASKDWAPLNILYCRLPEHHQLRASIPDIKKALIKYFGKFDCKTPDSNLKISVNCSFQVHGSSAAYMNHPPSMAPCIDSKSGAKVAPEKSKIIPEIREDSFYLMQILKIGNTNVLAFLDSGSNAHLIDSGVAERENLLKTSERTTSISVVGGGNIKSSKSSYQFNLGPGAEGEFYEMNCIAMDSITTRFKEYDLKDIADEYRATCGPESKDVILPSKVGGSKVHLLIGIKNAKLTPTLERILDSGVAVFSSPFTDIFGSNKIFAGPHKCFTSGNKGLKSHAVYHFEKQISETRRLIDENLEDELRIEENREHTIILSEELRLSIHPRPITDEDAEELGSLIPEQFEDGFECSHSHHHIDDQTLSMGNISSHKATIPIAKMRELIDIDDCEPYTGYRCPVCAKCNQCKTSVRTTAISLQEAAEQHLIEESVKLVREKKRVVVTLPFTQDPVKFLTNRHGGSDNYHQAIKTYKAQCKKPEHVKSKLRETHADLVRRKFMTKLSDMPLETQNQVNQAKFRHYHPWSVVAKEDSISTPIRLVVDPTRTGLNIILPKGENRLGSISNILIGNRADPFSWSSDITKLYNQLHLHDSAYPYSLFLYDDELNQEKKPQVWLMTVAWYGVTSTGSQAGCAIERAVQEGAEKYPLAVKCLTDRRYVDDLAPGAQTKEDRKMQEDQSLELLGSIGLIVKYIVRSGEDPCELASSDGKSVKLLGYKWSTKDDTLSPGFSELNLNKKIRGAKKPNETPVITRKDAEKLLTSIAITKRLVVSKVSEFFDPIGLFEPIKLQLKLELRKLTGLAWDEEISPELQAKWRVLLTDFVDLHELSAPRCIIPADNISVSKIRLICICDAAEHAGGAAIYAGRKLHDGTWSCAMVSAKSKLMKGTIPRNELSAIMLMTEVAFIVKKAFGDSIGEIIYITDSTIALCWVHNIAKRLRVYVLNRVETIRRMMEWTTGEEEVPLYHIDGPSNVADLLTKEHILSIRDVSTGSEWQAGKSWMRLDTNKMPLKQYSDLTVTPIIENEIDAECFDNLLSPTAFHQLFVQYSEPIFVAAVTTGRVNYELIVDPIRFGWFRALRIVKYVLKFVQKLKTKYILTTTPIDIQDCDAENVFIRYESAVIRDTLKPGTLQNFRDQDGIIYFQGRITEENPFRIHDLGKIPFLDVHEFTGKVPVLLVDSPILYAYILAIHTRILPHAGVEITMKTLSKKFKVQGNVRGLIKKIRGDCTRCAMILKKTVELEMSAHPAPRTILAPPFYSVMIDIAYGFPAKAFKSARIKVKVYALVIVCLMSGATSILAMEGIETQDVAQALEKHSCRHGVPAEAYIDQGTQLKALESAKFSIKDLETQMDDSLGIKIIASNAKAHEERGRVERKIRTLRNTLERLGVRANHSRTTLQWDYLFTKIANSIDDLPLARGDTSNVSSLGYEIITANRLKLGRNNSRSLGESGVKFDNSPKFQRIMENNRAIYQEWLQLYIDNIHNLTVKPSKWSVNTRKPCVDDIVLFTLNDSGYGKENITWKLGRVIETKERKVKITFAGNSTGSKIPKMHILQRNPRDVSILFSTEEFNINTNLHFQDVINNK